MICNGLHQKEDEYRDKYVDIRPPPNTREQHPKHDVPAQLRDSKRI